MTILIASAILPLAVFVGFSVYDDYVRTLAAARHDVVQSARIAAARQSQIFATSRLLLDTLRRSPNVSIEGGASCDATLAQFKEANPQFLTVGLMDADGVITCHNILRQRQPFTDGELVTRIMAANAEEFIVGNFMIGRVSKQPTFALAMAYRDAAGNKLGAVFASIDLARLSATAEIVSDGGRLAVAMVQPASGRILSHFPRNDVIGGTVLGNHPLFAAMRSMPGGGVAETAGLMGDEIIYGFEPIDGAETSGLMIAVGESRQALLAPIRNRAMHSAMAAAAVLIAALVAFWCLGDRLHMAPILQLTRTAGRIKNGDFAARSRLPFWHSPELRDLGETLNAMAVRLEEGREAERAVAASEARYRLLAANSADMITCLDRRDMRTFVSPACKEVIGWSPAELLTQPPSDLIHPEDGETVLSMMQVLRSGTPVTEVRYRMRHKDGRYIWVEVNGRPTEIDDQLVFVLRDVTARKAMEDELARANRQLASLASTDGLTQLLNRRAFDAVLEQSFDMALANGRSLSLLLLDVDQFKAFNDHYGHMAGDEALRAVAAELRAVLRRPGIAVARYGGEEFAVVLPETPLSTALQEAEALRHAVVSRAIAHERSAHGVVTISIGAATLTIGDTQLSRSDLIQRADLALYAAKRAGRNRTEFAATDLSVAS
ncbi:hypothetical protein GCM10011390_09440 [Aureimonas endophytica]|uniref:diguanylate cyclase n=1 Tax=Aureimonas endophytica TaxID=2027858 RepID=A0A916ZFI7_9HYPH|nr:diguanylate cyclase [Aureimonas endophytica]GGD92839.1 hypothetical protein GCM10011390_09440 [Aureimonas endophytica]